MLKCMKFAPLSSLGAVSSSKPFGFFFWSIFNCLMGKAKLLLESLIFSSSAVTWISPFSHPPPLLPTDPLLLRALHPSPRCHANNYWSLLLPAPSRSSLTFLKPKHLPGVFNTSPQRWGRHAASSCFCPRARKQAGVGSPAFILSARHSPLVWQKHIFSRNVSQFILSFDMLSPTINLTPLLLLPSHRS